MTKGGFLMGLTLNSILLGSELNGKALTIFNVLLVALKLQVKSNEIP
jgi:hypothetical protein